ncbi:lysosome-associated membrane glycoprotein 2 isoform X2 [Siphateles boraxobius]|uniref:lysosome-associated membrane glycoprotein 2 isoform X2 n=1 Tax=Siphateles boraxobius TaxID=180520 RepID=UPI0040635473
MAVRGCVTLLFFLLSGIVHADDLVTSLLPAAETSTSRLPVMPAGVIPTFSQQKPTNATTVPPTITQHTATNTTTVLPTTTQHKPTNTTTVLPTTTQHKPTNTTTVLPTTTQHKPTNTTTVPPTTTQHTPTNATTVPPTTQHTPTNATTEPPTTMHSNTTNSTTQAPTTTHPNATTAPTPPPTTPPVPNPTVGNYSVKSDNVSACLLAKMGLQFSVKISGNGSVQTLNLDPSPNVTEASGTCGIGGSDSSLVLKSKEMTVHFVFTNVSQKFHLHALTFSVDLGNGSIFRDSNHNLSLWEASFGSSYMCRKEQSYNISDKLTVHTFELQVQPFAVQKNMFGTAEECFLDSDLSFLVPIAVGVALSFLILLVLISYLIGRRKSRTGYQSV